MFILSSERRFIIFLFPLEVFEMTFRVTQRTENKPKRMLLFSICITNTLDPFLFAEAAAVFEVGALCRSDLFPNLGLIACKKNLMSLSNIL